MITGLGCTKSTMTPDLLHSLAEDRELVIFDNRGSVNSIDREWPRNLTIDDYATSILDFIDALDIEQPDILGWSLVIIFDPCLLTLLPSSSLLMRIKIIMVTLTL